MGFFTRPDLSNIQFQQMTGSTLTMSGTTNFSGVLKSKNVEIDASISGATSGDVLTYIGGGKIKLTAGAGSSAFNGNRTVTRSGIPNVNVGGSTVNQFLEGYFFPSVPPVASLSGGGTRDMGNNASFTLSWSVTRRTNPMTSGTVNGNSITSQITGLAQNATANGSFTGTTITTPNTNQTYNMTVSTASENVNASTSITFSRRRFFYGDSVNLIGLNNTDISNNVNLHLAQSEFASNRVKSTFTVTLASQFFYYVIPASFGVPSFVINGLSNTDFTSQSFTYTNQYGFAESFVVWRTNNLLSGNFNFSVS
jgi:hypothetical protein